MIFPEMGTAGSGNQSHWWETCLDFGVDELMILIDLCIKLMKTIFIFCLADIIMKTDETEIICE